VKRLATLALLAVAGCSAPSTAAPAGSPPGDAITAELAKVKVIRSKPEVPGYKRAQFGQTWTDDHNGRGGHNDCDTRNDMLKASLTEKKFRGHSTCVVVAGDLNDPYTGRKIAFRKLAASEVQIDHVYPLGRAWDMGAAGWSPEQRIDFANDQAANLLAVDGKANASKGDSGPGEWLPLAKGYRCAYVLQYLQVADRYDLPITADDRDAAETLTPTCGGGR